MQAGGKIYQSVSSKVEISYLVWCSYCLFREADSSSIQLIVALAKLSGGIVGRSGGVVYPHVLA